MLGLGVYRLAQNLVSNPLKPETKRRIIQALWRSGTLYAVILFVTLGIPAVVIPTIGIVMEVEYAQHAECPRRNVNIFITYCILNMFRYLFAFGSRTMIVLATIAIKTIWFSDRLLVVHFHADGETVELEASSQVHHRRLIATYRERGRVVSNFTRVFHTWYLIPWIAFFIATSVKTTRVLKPWSKKAGDVTLLASFYYMLYSINQVVSLGVVYICGLKINGYHHRFFQRMKNKLKQPGSAKSNCTCDSSSVFIEKDEDFDFVPHLVGIKVPIENPMYVVFLFLGIFLYVCGSLF